MTVPSAGNSWWGRFRKHEPPKLTEAPKNRGLHREFRRKAADEHAVRRVEVHVDGLRHPVTTAPVITQSGVVEYVLLARWASVAVGTSLASTRSGHRWRKGRRASQPLRRPSRRRSRR